MPVNWTISTASSDFSSFTSTHTSWIQFSTTGITNAVLVSNCACGNRRDRHWEHAEQECTWLSPLLV